MIGDKIAAEFNKQINAEFYSSYLYLAMAAHLESANLRGFAHWMRLQAQEEHAHAMRIYDHILQRGGQVKLTVVAAPPGQWPSPSAVFEEVFAHERKVTGMIDALAALADAEKDRAAAVMLHWFIAEQVEEEANAAEILAKLRMIKDSTGGLLAIDHQLGKRGQKS